MTDIVEILEAVSVAANEALGGPQRTSISRVSGLGIRQVLPALTEDGAVDLFHGVLVVAAAMLVVRHPQAGAVFAACGLTYAAGRVAEERPTAVPLNPFTMAPMW